MPRPVLAGGVDDDVVVAVGGDDAIVGVGVDPAHHIDVAGIDPTCGYSHERIVQWRLAALLPPWAGVSRVLHRQSLAVGQGFHHWVMPKLLGDVKNWRADGGKAAQ